MKRFQGKLNNSNDDIISHYEYQVNIDISGWTFKAGIS